MVITAQDVAYYGVGRQFIPLDKTNVILKKEVLKIEKSRNDIKFNIHLELYNPGEESIVMLGLVTDSPSGAAELPDMSGKNNSVKDFYVNMNGIDEPYSVAVVKDEDYYKNGKFITVSSNEMKKQIDEYEYEWCVDFFYVYYFPAKFKKGLNILDNSYILSWSANDMPQTFFAYSLHAITGWANNEAEDFTMEISPGEHALFDILNSSLIGINEAKITGIGKKTQAKAYYHYDRDLENLPDFTRFYIREGSVIFNKKNFREKTSVFIARPILFASVHDFDYKEDDLLPHNYTVYNALEAKDDISKRILRNLPFAKRGYLFGNPILKKYYEKQFWYIPNPDYKADMATLSQDEQEWVAHYSE